MNIIETRNDLFKLLPKNMVIAELGVFIGSFSEIILSTCSPKELHLIDLWNKSFKSGDKDGRHMARHMARHNLPVIYQNLVEKYANSNIVKLHRTDTIKALATFEDDYFDFIYIDANHQYKSVYSELNLSYFKSKKYISVHDYNRKSEVKKAVDQFCEEKKLEIKYITKDGCPSFLIEK